MSTPELIDDAGRVVRLGKRLDRGGQGSVFQVEGHPDQVAKVYHVPPTAADAEKVCVMVRLQNAALREIATWPLASVRTRNGSTAGFTMPRLVDRRAIHYLYGPKDRLAQFPDATFPFLIHSAANLARSFVTVHAAGHVVGDVNHANAFIAHDGTVKLIDCDSFQICDGSTGRVFPCPVGVGTHQPPEIQALGSYDGLRAPNHDAFGLAVLIFQLLFMGRHPFAGVYLGSGDMPIEKAIQEYRFAYGPSASLRQMKPPPSTLPLEAVGPLAPLFERAFLIRNGARPAASEWVTALSVLAGQLRTCVHNPTHQFLNQLITCPWCAIESSAGFLLFNVRVSGIASVVSSAGFALETVWAQITSVASPGAAPMLPSPPALGMKASPRARRIGVLRRLRWAFALALLLVGVLFAYAGEQAKSKDWAYWFIVPGAIAWGVAIQGRQDERRAFDQSGAEARARWTRITAQWQHDAGDGAFTGRFKELEKARADYLDIPNLRQRKISHLQATARERQLHKFLDQHRITQGRIRNIGQSREMTLRSFGIESAADVTYARVISVPGFGHSLTSDLLAWRQSIEQRFRFNPARAIEPADVRQVDQEIAALRVQLEQTLRRGAADLQQLVEQARLRRTAMLGDINRVAQDLAQAEADARAV